MVQYIQTFILNRYKVTNTPIIIRHIPITFKYQHHTVKDQGLLGFIRQKRTLEFIFVELRSGFWLEVIQKKRWKTK